MNKGVVIRFILCLVIAGFIFSCEEKTVDYGLDTYFVEIVTAQNENEFLSDNGNRIVATSYDNKKTYTSGDRVLLNYTLLSSTSSENIYNVRINGSTKIPLGKLVLSNDSSIYSTGKEPVLLESLWLGSHYLNIQFYFNYKSVTHKIGLLADSLRLESDTIRMYFTHDSDNDPPGYPNHVYLSFDLNEVLGAPGNSRPVSVRMNTSNYGEKTYEFEY